MPRYGYAYETRGHARRLPRGEERYHGYGRTYTRPYEPDYASEYGRYYPPVRRAPLFTSESANRGVDYFGLQNAPYVEARVNPHVRRLQANTPYSGRWQRIGQAPPGWSRYAWEYTGGASRGAGFWTPDQADRRIGGMSSWVEGRGPHSGRGPRRQYDRLDMGRAPRRGGGPPSAPSWRGSRGPQWIARENRHFPGNEGVGAGRTFRG